MSAFIWHRPAVPASLERVKHTINAPQACLQQLRPLRIPLFLHCALQRRSHRLDLLPAMGLPPLLEPAGPLDEAAIELLAEAGLDLLDLFGDRLFGLGAEQ